MLKEQVHRAERTSTPMLKEQEHDNYNGEWLLHSVNLFADQKLNALAHTIHAHTHTHTDVHIIYACRNYPPTFVKRTIKSLVWGFNSEGRGCECSF